MKTEAKPVDTTELRLDRIKARISDFAAFCSDSIQDGMGDDLDDDAFLESAMETYLDVYRTHREDGQEGK